MPVLSLRDIPHKLRRELPELKREHPHLYAVKTSGGVFVLRPLTWREHKHVKEKVQYELLPEVSIVDMTLVWPDSIPDQAPAGVIHTLAAAAMEIAGFDNPVAIASAWAHAEQQIEDDPEHFMVMTICKAFPAYKPEELYEMQFLDLMLRFKQAEKMLEMGPTLIIPEGQQPPQQPQPRRQSRRREPRVPIQELGDDVMAFGPDEEFHPVPVARRSADPLRDPNLPPPDFARDNEFFRREFGNHLTKTPQPGEV